MLKKWVIVKDYQVISRHATKKEAMSIAIEYANNSNNVWVTSEKEGYKAIKIK
jgi:hypothetical protein